MQEHTADNKKGMVMPTFQVLQISLSNPICLLVNI